VAAGVLHRRHRDHAGGRAALMSVSTVIVAVNARLLRLRR